MSELLKRLAGLGRAPLARSQRKGPRHPLFQDIDALEPEQGRAFVCALSLLWDEYTSQWGSSRPSPEDAQKLRSLSHQVRQNGGSSKLHYALAPEIMALYAELLAKPERSPREEEILLEIAQHAKRGSLIRRFGTGGGGAP